MSNYIRVFCRSGRPILLSEVTSFIEDGVYFEDVRFDPLPGEAEEDWQRLTIFYQPEKRPIVLHKNVNDALVRKEIAEISAETPAGEIGRRLQGTAQMVAIEIGSLSTLTDEAWEMLDSLEAYLAQTYDGIIFVGGEGFYDAALQKLE